MAAKSDKRSSSDAPATGRGRGAGAEVSEQILGLDRDIALTALRMLAYFSLFVVVSLLAVPAEVRMAAQQFTAAVSAELIRAAGIDVTLQGTLLLLPGITLAIDWACTAITILELYIALILAYRSSVWLKALGIVVGSAVIFIANQARIVATALAAEYWPEALHVAHDYLFQVSMVVVALSLWLWWLGLVGKAGEGRGE